MEGKKDPQTAEEAAGLKLCHLGQEVTVPAGTRIVSQGEVPEFFYIIQSGRVRVFKTEEGIRVDLTELKAGAYFGEMALVTRQLRTASVEAAEEARLIKVSQEEFDHLLDHNPQLARHIIRQLSGWLVASDNRVVGEVVHQVRLRELSWFDYVLMVGLSIVLALIFNLYNDNKIPLIQGWGEKDNIPQMTLNQALEAYRQNQAIFIDARKSAFFTQEHIKGAQNLPLILFDLMYPMFNFALTQTPGAKDKTVIVYGGTISRRFDLELARLLKQKGWDKVEVLKEYRGWPRVFPLEEQAPKTPASLPLGVAGYLEWLPVSIFLLILIPPIRRSPYLAVAGRVLLGAIFISFALSKILRPAVFALNVVDYAITPAWGVNLWSLILPWAELMVGLFLILGIRTRAAATLIGAMNIVFIVGLVNAILHHMPINCGCVGEPVNWWKVTKNVGMLVMCIQIFLYDRLLVLDRGGFIWRDKKI